MGRTDEIIQRINNLKEELKRLKQELQLAQMKIELQQYLDNYELQKLNSTIKVNTHEILNLEKQIKMLELGKVIK